MREAQIHFSAPYVLIEGTYLVKKRRSFQHVEQLDQPGLRLAVGEGRRL